MRLTQRQLRKIVESVIKENDPHAPGHPDSCECPLCAAQPKHSPTGDLDEAELDEVGSHSPVDVTDVAGSLVRSAEKYFYGMYNEDDPSMQEAGGKDAWDRQCDIAIDTLLNEVEDVLSSIEDRLINGEFYRGK